MYKFNREIYFDSVRNSLFYGDLNQGQVDGQNAILDAWEKHRGPDQDMRFLAYELATTIHETASTMLPIEEYGKGSGHDYGEPDPETGQTYYGRGFVQLTWRDNYARADSEAMTFFGVNPGIEWDAARALEPKIAAAIMFMGMEQGWFRGDSEGRQTLARYFNDNTDDPVNARDIINGDISKNGGLIAGYHERFLDALTDAWEEYEPAPPVDLGEEGEEEHEHIPGISTEPEIEKEVLVALTIPDGVKATITVNGDYLSE